VLIIDDDGDFRQTLVALMTLHGAHASEADCAAAGRARLSRERFDLLVSDINMPGEDGVAMIARIRDAPDAALRTIRAAAMSARCDADMRREAIAAGFDLFMCKLEGVSTIVRMLEGLAPPGERCLGP
jgi:CheY-like chemotaxis protein